MDIQRSEELTPGSLREFVRVALPLVLSAGSLSLMYIIDRVFLTWATTDDYPALAAVLPAALLHWTLISVFIGTITYVNTFVAQYEGAGRPQRVAASVWQGVYLALASGLAFVAVAPFSPAIFALFDHAPRVQALEVEYFSIFCLGAVPMTLSSALSSFYSGRGDNLVVMLVNFGMAGANVLLDWLLIFGAGPIPPLGVRGAAIATVIAYGLSALAYALLITFSNAGRQYQFARSRAFDPELFRRLLRYGLPTGFQYLADIAGFTVFILLVGTMGRQAMEATTIAFNINSLAFIPMFGCGIAVMTLVGKRIGEGRPDLAARTTWLAFALGSGYMLIFAAVYLLLPDAMLAVYALGRADADFAAVRGQVVWLLRFVALYTFFDGMAIVFSSAVRGAGDTRFCLVFTLLTGWLLMVLPTWIAAENGWLSLTVCWSACTVYLLALGVGFLLRFLAGKWRTMRVIEHDAADPLPREIVAPAIAGGALPADQPVPADCVRSGIPG